MSVIQFTDLNVFLSEIRNSFLPHPVSRITEHSLLYVLRAHYISLEGLFKAEIDVEVDKVKLVSRLFYELMSEIERTTVIPIKDPVFTYTIRAVSWNIDRHLYGGFGLPIL